MAPMNDTGNPKFAPYQNDYDYIAKVLVLREALRDLKAAKFSAKALVDYSERYYMLVRLGDRGLTDEHAELVIKEEL